MSCKKMAIFVCFFPVMIIKCFQRGKKELLMNYLSELKSKIETVRKRLDVAVGKDVCAPECYQMSIQLDKLIEDYIQHKDEVQQR